MCSLLQPTIGTLADYGICLITKGLIPIIFTIALVMFVWGVVNYFILNAGEEAKRNKGKQFIIWGIIAFVVITSVWGLVRIFGTTVGVNTRVIPGVTPNKDSLRTGGGGITNTNQNPNNQVPIPSTYPGGTDCDINYNDPDCVNGNDPITPAPCYFEPEGCGGL